MDPNTPGAKLIVGYEVSVNDTIIESRVRCPICTEFYDPQDREFHDLLHLIHDVSKSTGYNCLIGNTR